MTPSTSNLDWLYHLLGYSLAAAGLLLLLWSLFWDRSRGRRRCPKCWYDMSGVPGLTCPECGREVRLARRLLKTRRWWRLAGIGVAASVAGYVVASVPEVVHNGWRSTVPSTILIASVSWLESPSNAEMYRPGTPLSVGKSLYVELIKNRLLTGKLNPWQRRWLMGHMIHGDRLRPQYSPAWRESFEQTLSRIHEAMDLREAPKSWQLNDQVALDLDQSELHQLRTMLARACIRTRARWPQGVPVFVRLDTGPLVGWNPKELCTKANLPESQTIRSYVQGLSSQGCVTDAFTRPWRENLVSIGIGTMPQPTTTFDILLHNSPDANPPVLVHDRAELPLCIAGRVDDVITPCPSAAIEEYIRASVRPTVGFLPSGNLAVGLGSSWCGLLNGDNALAQLCAEPVRLTLGVKITLLCDGRVISSAKAWWSTRADHNWILRGNGSAEFSRWENVVMLTPSSAQYPPAGSRLEVRLTGDGEVSLRDLESDRYWQGDIVLPATWQGDMTNAWKQ